LLQALQVFAANPLELKTDTDGRKGCVVNLWVETLG